MLTVNEAQALVLNCAKPPALESVALSDSQGLVLAEDVASDLDMPPYDKALVDGFAVRSADLPQGTGELEIVAEIFAGQSLAEKAAAVGPGQAVRIMTGAPIPPGADAVVMVERTGEEGSGFRASESRRAGVQGSGPREQHPLVGVDPQSAIRNPQSPTTHDSPPTTHHRRVTINDPKLRPGQNIMRRGTELTCGQV
ncbi:MAG: hypothetical protein HY000_37365, partial [Planctomycetes bacterium]|nr:hypothetical protein [Planctomycetota bacterium]